MKKIILAFGLIILFNGQTYAETVNPPANGNEGINITVPNNENSGSLDPKLNNNTPTANPYNNNSEITSPRESIGSIIPRAIFRILNLVL